MGYRFGLQVLSKALGYRFGFRFRLRVIFVRCMFRLCTLVNSKAKDILIPLHMGYKYSFGRWLSVVASVNSCVVGLHYRFVL